MARASNKAAPKPIPGVKTAKWTPILRIPAVPDREQRVARRGNSTQPTHVDVRFAACCNDHRANIHVGDLMTQQELDAMIVRMQSHYGHPKLLGKDAELVWVDCEDRQPCADCLAEAAQKRAEAAEKVEKVAA